MNVGVKATEEKILVLLIYTGVSQKVLRQIDFTNKKRGLT